MILAKEQLLKDYEDYTLIGDDEGSCPTDYVPVAGDVKLALSYFKDRWERTLGSMSDLHHDPKSKSLREIGAREHRQPFLRLPWSLTTFRFWSERFWGRASGFWIARSIEG